MTSAILNSPQMISLSSDVHALSYPDFVGFIGQANAPPGADRTLIDWIELSGIERKSHILDLACSTGFSSRGLCERSGCSAVGIDLSEMALAVAQTEASQLLIEQQCSYQNADATSLPFSEHSFTHVVAGCCFGFIASRDAALKECARVLKCDGYLCVSAFHYTEPPPDELLDEVEQAIGYRPNPQRNYEYWYRFFATLFHLQSKRTYMLEPCGEEKTQQSVQKYMSRNALHLHAFSGEIQQACYDRLLSLRLALDRHREYQKLSVMTWCKR